MTSRIISIAFFLIFSKSLAAQQSQIDSLKYEISRTENDTIQLLLLAKIANVYSEMNPDSAYHYAGKLLPLTKKLNLGIEEVVALGEIGYALLNMGNYPRSLQYLLSAISIAEDEKIEKNVLSAIYPATDDYRDRSVSSHMQRLATLSRTNRHAGTLYALFGNNEKAVRFFKSSISIAEQSQNLRLQSITHTDLGRTYFRMNEYDSAMINLQKAYECAVSANYNRYIGSIFLNMGRVYMATGKQDSAKAYFRTSLIACSDYKYLRGVAATNLALADMFKQAGQPDSNLYYLQNGLAVARELNIPDIFLRTYAGLAAYYNKKGNSDSTVKYQSLIIKMNDSLFNSKQAQQFQNIDFDAQQKEQEIGVAKKEYQNRLQKYLLIGGLVFLLSVAVFLMRNNRNRKRTNAILQRQNMEIEMAMINLRATQSQLVQSEKMASLGELTAGIAHEIQNPLNFVNNFSELSNELITEMNEEINKGNTDEVKAIANDIKQNLKKINHHGKRADSIVKGMLQHSQKGSGLKEPTDINAMAEEYLRLAYHARLNAAGGQGCLAKDITLNVSFVTDLDKSIGNVNLVQQDINRVLLNLYNNAFYAISERQKQETSDYQPTVTLTTKKIGDNIEIYVKDNGVGIPEKIRVKIFQPFFTTKPTGKGTGLGLSLSYDIIKSHGGEVKVESEEGKGSEFIIKIPRDFVSG